MNTKQASLYPHIVRIKHLLFHPVTGILLLAAVLRFSWFLTGLPVYVSADEELMISLTKRVVAGELNPGWFYYPSFYFYVTTVVYYLSDFLYPILHFLDITERVEFSGWLVFAAVRGANICYALGMVFLTFRIGLLLFSRTVGLWASLLLAVLPFNLDNSVVINPNMLLAFMCTLGLYFSALFLVRGSVQYYYLGCIVAGLAFSTKYMFAMPLAPFLAWFIRNRQAKLPFVLKPYLLGITVVAIGAFIGSPYIFIEFRKTFAALFCSHSLYESGRPGMQSDIAIISFVQYFWSSGFTPLLFAAACAGWIWQAVRHTSGWIVLSVAPIVWTLYLGSYAINQPYNVLIITVPLCVGAGFLISSIPGRIQRWGVGALIVLLPLIASVKTAEFNRRQDIRYEVSDWVNSNLPAGSRIMREEYTPYFDSVFYVTDIGICGLSYICPDSIRRSNVDFLVTNVNSHGRHLTDTAACRPLIQTYKSHFKEFDTVRRFEPGNRFSGEEIVILAAGNKQSARSSEIVSVCNQEELDTLPR
jgi:4-amino-4-deoxy-L-arabinose transferase-like glycosyltransferase